MHPAWFLAGFFLVDVGDTEGSGGSVFSIWLFSNNLELSMMLAALAAFYFTKGQIRLNRGEQSGQKIQRFNAHGFQASFYREAGLVSALFVVPDLCGDEYLVTRNTRAAQAFP